MGVKNSGKIMLFLRDFNRHVGKYVESFEGVHKREREKLRK